MGVINVTPDSFSDGGLHLDDAAAVAAGRAMIDQGADLVDIGGESTRPGAEAVPAIEELRRVIPIVEALVAGGAVVSIDTSKPEVARAALDAGAEIVNDVTAAATPGMTDVLGESGAGVVLMHMKGTPRTMQREPTYDDVVGEVAAFLDSRAQLVIDAGVAPGSGRHRSRDRVREDGHPQPGVDRRAWRSSPGWASRWSWGRRARRSWDVWPASKTQPDATGSPQSPPPSVSSVGQGFFGFTTLFRQERR